MIIDLNCDMGEGFGTDAAMMPFISSANIACGYHAGDEDTMKETIRATMEHGVQIGAHPSFFDRENFGRKEMSLPVAEIYDLVSAQMKLLNAATNYFGTKINHVKPHGALYNMSASDPFIAEAIANAIRDFDPRLILFGLSGSHSISRAEIIGLKTANEVFADRTYRDDGSLTPRSQPGALIEDADIAVQQALQMIKEKSVTTITGKKIPVAAETICIHGDGKYAVVFAKRLHEELVRAGIKIQPVKK